MRKSARRWGLDAVSVGQDRSTGQAALRFRDEQGRLVALRMRRQQFQTFAKQLEQASEAVEAQS